MHQSLKFIVELSMKQESLSLRKLSELSGISASSISRILNNKQSANIYHLQKFSECLNIPIETLLQAVGININNIDENSKFILSMVKNILSSFDIELDNLIEDVKKELYRCEQYAKSNIGQKTIKDEFISKINKLNGEGMIINQLNILFDMFNSKEVPQNTKSVIGSVLLYFIQTPDVIPDYAFPLEYLDDAVAVYLILDRLSNEFNITL